MSPYHGVLEAYIICLISLRNTFLLQEHVLGIVPIYLNHIFLAGIQKD